MDYLNAILERKRADLKKILPLEGKLRASAILRNDYAGFRTAVDLGENRLSVIPEISRSYPAPGAPAYGHGHQAPSTPCSCRAARKASP